jgi:Flp pilus assembly protein TadG
MKRATMKTKKSERGQSLVELAISLVLLLLLLSGAVELGMAFFQYVQLRDAAQEGALYGSMNPPANAGDTTQKTKIADRAKAASQSPIKLQTDATVNVTVDVTDNKYCEGGSLKVTVSYPHKIFMPFLPRVIGSTIPLSASVTDTILTPVCP